jgi:hypothetical protein
MGTRTISVFSSFDGLRGLSLEGIIGGVISLPCGVIALRSCAAAAAVSSGSLGELRRAPAHLLNGGRELRLAPGERFDLLLHPNESDPLVLGRILEGSRGRGRRRRERGARAAV